MSDIVERLRQAANDSDGWSTGRMDVMDEAADEIERLRGYAYCEQCGGDMEEWVAAQPLEREVSRMPMVCLPCWNNFALDRAMPERAELQREIERLREILRQVTASLGRDDTPPAVDYFRHASWVLIDAATLAALDEFRG